MSLLKVRNLKRVYQSGNATLEVLSDVNFCLDKGESLAIVGPSGSGKSTLLALCAGLDKPDSGEILLDGEELTGKSEDQLAVIRNKKVGFVFQDFQLLPSLTALENTMLPLELAGHRNASEAALELLDKVGLRKRGHHFPSQLSGGEQQRVAIARACINQPEILFADEPTGNLDSESSKLVADLLFEITKSTSTDHSTALLLVTHDPTLAGRSSRSLVLNSGILEDSKY